MRFILSVGLMICAGWFSPTASAAARLMLVGDSITEGGGNFAAYPSRLAAKLTAAGLAVEFVGTRQAGATGEIRHEGYSGRNADFLAATVPAHFADSPADFVLIHAGHNYTSEEQPVATILAATERLVVSLRTVNPSVTVLLAQVIPSGKLPKYAYIPELNAKLAELATRLNRASSPVVLVDQAAGFDWRTDTIDDRVHPNEMGAEKIAQRWFEALAPLLKNSKRPLPEFHVRQGLPNVRAKLEKGEPVRVAFLGGSITAASGWRVHTLAWLKAAYPRTRFEEIVAAVSGTGSDYGAMRFQRDVLRHKPDLVFVEFAVNDGSGSPAVEAQMEGIVRQAWVENPRVDLCFVYTVNVASLDDLLAGEYQSAARSMEQVAAYYDIPSFNFGIEVARRVAAGTLVMVAPADAADPAGNDPQGRLVLTADKTHPTPAGHRVYADRLIQALPAILDAGARGPHALPEPRRADNWQRARILAIEETGPDNNWHRVPSDDIHVTTQLFPSLVPPTWVAFEPDATIEFSFQGTVLGLVGLKGPENGKFRVTVDDLAPQTGTLFDRYSQPGRFFLTRWIYPRRLADTEHRVRLELLGDKIDKAGIMADAGTPVTDEHLFAPHGLYLSGFLIVGEPVTSARGAPSPAAKR